MKRILVATDGSAGGNAAVDAALDLAHETGALLTVVCVRRLPDKLGTPHYQHALSDQLRKGRAIIDEATERAEAAGVEVETEIMSGDAAEEIVRLAAHRDAELIVVGSHARGRVATALLGSVANAIVKDADRPVLVVKPKVTAELQAA